MFMVGCLLMHGNVISCMVCNASGTWLCFYIWLYVCVHVSLLIEFTIKQCLIVIVNNNVIRVKRKKQILSHQLKETGILFVCRVTVPPHANVSVCVCVCGLCVTLV